MDDAERSILLEHLRMRALDWPPPDSTLQQIAAGDFGLIPDDLTWGPSTGVAHLINGYDLSPKLGYGPLQQFANRSVEEAQRGGWAGSLAALWLCLFAEHRRARHGGFDPTGESLGLMNDLCRAFALAASRTEA